MHKWRTAMLASLALTGGAALAVTVGPAASAAAFDPCSALSQGKLRYPTGTATRLVLAISPAYASNHVGVTECVKKGRSCTKVTETPGRAGANGFAEPGEKREGDGKSPTGSFPVPQGVGEEKPRTRDTTRGD